MPNNSAKKKTHRIVYLNYLPRVVGYFLVGLILFSVFYGRLTVISTIWIILYTIVWPHLALYIGLKNRMPKRAVMINYAIETFFGGLCISLLSFSLWPTLIITVAGFANYIITGGVKVVYKIFPFAILGAIMGGLIWGVHFEPESSMLTALLCCLFMLVYISVISYGFYGNAKKLYRSKKELNEANNEIAEKFESANQEIINRKKIEKELLKVNKDLQSFAYVVSHDLKGPLRGMSSLLHFIQEDLSQSSKETTAENFELLFGRVHRLNHLITGILEYSKIQKVDKIESSVNVKQIVEEILQNLDIPGKFTLDVAIEPGLNVAFNEGYIYEIFTNLISNSIKYNNANKPIIKVGYEPNDEYHHFFVEDNGLGVPDKFKSKVFEMFQKMHSRDEIEGSGIGLSIVKRILNQNGGDIWIESSEDQHTFFHFIIPRQVDLPENLVS